MCKIKLLHCADIHIGAELSYIGNKSKQRREEILMTFDKIVSICGEENIQLLLIAGDLFQSSNMDKDIVSSVKKSLKKIPNTIVAIAPGNHDYISIDSFYLDEDWPENVHIFKSELEFIEFKELGLRLWGAGFTSSYITSSMLSSAESINNFQDNMVNICIIHGDLISENQTSNYNPISVSQLKSSGMDYVALGHIHKRTEILKAGNTYYAYSGCCEGEGFDELGEKGVIMGTVMKTMCSLEFCPICKRMNLELRVDISGTNTNNEAAEIVLNAIKNYEKSLHTKSEMLKQVQQTSSESIPVIEPLQYSKHLYKIILEGALDANFKLDCQAIAARLESEVFFIKINDETHIEIDMDSLTKESSLKGIFARKMMDKINKSINIGNNTDANKYRKALYIGLKAFERDII
ncbi:MAG: DNA repair exonuclease [Bacillota bacterium]|nr:DNA repair exonuclease [Bacillota bacterium]